MIKCENCDIPKGTYENPGVEVEITRRAVNAFKRESHVTVWCCTEKCAVQTRARAKYGEVSRNWPVSLAKFAAMEKASDTRKKHQEMGV